MTSTSRCCETYIQSTKVNVAVWRSRNVSSAKVTLKRRTLAPHLSFEPPEDTAGAEINRRTARNLAMYGTSRQCVKEGTTAWGDRRASSRVSRLMGRVVGFWMAARGGMAVPVNAGRA